MTNVLMIEGETAAQAQADEAAQSSSAAPEVAKKPTARARATRQETNASSAGQAPAKSVRATAHGKTATGKLSPSSATPTGKPMAGDKLSKTDSVLKLLRAAKGASVAQIEAATGWQAHSVRGFLSGTVRKKLGLTLTSETGKDGERRYRIVATPVTSGADAPSTSVADAPSTSAAPAAALTGNDGDPAHPVDGEQQLNAHGSHPSAGG